MTSSSPQRQGPFFPRALLASLVCAVAAALTWTLVECGRMIALAGRAAAAPSFFATVFLLYALPSLAFGVAAGFLAWTLRPWLERLGKGQPVAAAFAILLPGMFLGWGALLSLAYVNFNLASAALEPLSLAADAGIVVVALGLFGVCVARLLRRRTFSRPGVLRWGSGAAAILLLASFAVARTSGGGEEPARGPLRGAEKRQPRGPNILLVSIDALRADHVSAYGYGRETTPFIDTLAREGALFRNSRSQTTWTRSSVASLITSLYPSSHGTHSWSDAIPGEITTLFEYLKLAGYRTAVFSANGNVSPTFGFGQGVDDFYQSLAHGFAAETVLYRAMKRVNFPAQVLLRSVSPRTAVRVEDRGDRDLWVIRRFQEWIGELDAQPFFAYVHLIGVHMPYLPPPPYDALFGSPDRSAASEWAPANWGDVKTPGDQVPESRRQEMIDRYDGLARFSDAQVKVAVEAVRQKGLLDDTLVIVTADHGEAFGDHQIWGHGKSLYEELVRVPLVMWAGEGLRKRNGRIPSGMKDVTVSTIDIMPTAVSLSGVDCPTCEGESLIDLAERGRRSRSTFLELYTNPDQYLCAIQDEHQKLIYANFSDGEWERWELYDLEADPLETKSLLEGFPGERMPLARDLEARRQEALVKKSAPAQVDPRKDPRLYEELKALGYVGD